MHKPECFSFKIWELFSLFFFPAALHLGYSISCLCPCLIFQLTRLSSSSHDSALRYSECSKATQMHWFRTLHRPNLSSRNLPFFLLCWQIMWGCCSQEPDFEIVYLCVYMCVWRGVCVCVRCILRYLWGSDKHMCTVAQLRNRTPAVSSW